MDLGDLVEPSVDTLAQMVHDAGFADVRVHAMYRLGTTDVPTGPWRVSILAST